MWSCSLRRYLPFVTVLPAPPPSASGLPVLLLFSAPFSCAAAFPSCVPCLIRHRLFATVSFPSFRGLFGLPFSFSFSPSSVPVSCSFNFFYLSNSAPRLFGGFCSLGLTRSPSPPLRVDVCLLTAPGFLSACPCLRSFVHLAPAFFIRAPVAPAAYSARLFYFILGAAFVFCHSRFCLSPFPFIAGPGVYCSPPFLAFSTLLSLF